MNSLESVIQRMQDTDAKTVYGEPVTSGDRTVIPVASVAYGFGGGDEQEPGGGGILAQPMGYIEVGPQETRFVPIGNIKRILGVFVAGVAIGMLVGGRKR